MNKIIHFFLVFSICFNSPLILASDFVIKEPTKAKQYDTGEHAGNKKIIKYDWYQEADVIAEPYKGENNDNNLADGKTPLSPDLYGGSIGQGNAIGDPIGKGPSGKYDHYTGQPSSFPEFTKLPPSPNNKKPEIDEQGISNWNLKNQIKFWNKVTSNEIRNTKNGALIYFSAAQLKGLEFKRNDSETFGENFKNWIKTNNLDFKVPDFIDIHSFGGEMAHQLIATAGWHVLSSFQYQTEFQLYLDRIKEQENLTRFLAKQSETASNKIYSNNLINQIGDALEKNLAKYNGDISQGNQDNLNCIITFEGTCDQSDDFDLKSEQKANEIGQQDLFKKIEEGKKQLIRSNARLPQEVKAKAIGFELLRAADNSLSNGNVDESSDYLEIFKQIASIALGWDPITGTGISAYEAITGENIFTGETLTTEERAFAVLGIVTTGFANKSGKGFKLLNIFAKDSRIFKESISHAEQLLDSAKRIGINTKEGLKDFAEFTRRTFGNEVGAVGKVDELVESSTGLAKKLKFTTTTTQRMENVNRHVSINMLATAIKYGKEAPDPQGTAGAMQYTIEMFKNGKKYNLDVVYREADNTILHFLYK